MTVSRSPQRDDDRDRGGDLGRDSRVHCLEELPALLENSLPVQYLPGG